MLRPVVQDGAECTVLRCAAVGQHCGFSAPLFVVENHKLSGSRRCKYASHEGGVERACFFAEKGWWAGKGMPRDTVVVL